MTDREDRIAIFRTNVIDNQWDSQTKDLGNEILAYISAKKASFPSTPMSWYAWSLVQNVTGLFNPLESWTDTDERLFEIIVHPKYWKNNSSNNYYEFFDANFFRYLATAVRNEQPYSTSVIEQILVYWKKYKLDEKELLRGVAEHMPWEKEGTLTSAGQYLLQKIKDDFNSVFKVFLPESNHQLLSFLLKFDNAFADAHLSDFLAIQKDKQNTNRKNYISWFSVQALLEKDAKKYEPYILEKLPHLEQQECIYHVYKLLLIHFPEKYKNDIAKFAYIYLDAAKDEMNLKKGSYREPGYDSIWNEAKKQYDHMSFTEVHIKNLLLNADSKETLPYMGDLFAICEETSLKGQFLTTFIEYYKEAFLPYVMASGLDVPTNDWRAEEYYRRLFKVLAEVDYSAFEAKIWSFCRSKSKKVREMAAVLLAKQGEKAVPEATKLLNDKKGETRQIGALILSLTRVDSAQKILLETIDNEKNDDARDVMLESLAGVLPILKSEEEIKSVIEKAAKRGKLSQALEAWLDETQLPKLYWLSGEEFSAEAIRFLFYRQSRVKDIRIDVEAKPLLDFIDKTKSKPFAEALLNAFLNNGADAKYKFCLTLATILGSDDEVDILKAKVLQWSDAGRGKMGEYAVKAIALNGSNKALRAVEFFFRKFKNKYKNIGAAANESFSLVAEELNIHPYELADSIIPDFGFTGLFKEFEVNGEPYRAFVNNDFKMAFLNEDSKMLKSLPKGTPKELQDEFKEIAKEIRDIVKSQSSRLEQYLVIQRKWTTERWQAFFLENPVMFAYAIRLVWGIYQDNTLVSTFLCQEDQTLVNEEGDEISLEDGSQIGIVHPISLNEQQINYWTENLLDAELEPIFPQLNRPVVLLPDWQKATRMSNEFKGVQYGGFGFVSKMEKLGWNRGSVIDGGGIASYYKDFSALGITAIIMQEGVLGIGYYEENAELGSLMFVRNKSVSFGSYVYDEPDKENDPRLIPFGDVPPIVYSEVVADMQFFKENDAKKQSN